MADVFAHVLAAYALLTVLSWCVEWLTRRWVVVGTCGAGIPDLAKIGYVVEEGTVREALGLPFTWEALHTLWGVLVVAGAVASLFGGRRRRAFVALLVGGGSHLLLDGLRVYADGHATFWLYPFWWRPPTPNLYVSTDWRATVLVAVVALVVHVVDSGHHEGASDLRSIGNRRR